jgi:peptidoglycan/xylan/chitin deacetylase (PgdA/CDA1 family)
MKRRLSRAQLVAMHSTIKHHVVKLTPKYTVEGLIILILAVQFVVLGINSFKGHTVVVGVRLQGHVVGHAVNSDFKKQTDAIINTRENKTIPIKVAGTNYRSMITLRQLGEKIDRKQLYTALSGIGHTGNVFARLADQNIAVFGGRNILLRHPNFSTTLATEYIGTLDRKIDVTPTNAHFVLDNQKVLIQPDKDGTIIDAAAGINAILNTDPARGSLVTMPTKLTHAAVTLSLIQPLLPQVANITQKPLTVSAAGASVALTPDQLVKLLVVKVVPGAGSTHKTEAQISFDESALGTIVDEVVKKSTVASEPTIMSDGRVIRPGKPGLKAQDDHPIVQVLAALLQRQTGTAMPDAVQIPMVLTEPIAQQVAGNPLSRTGTGSIRLTFDDGPGAYTEQVLDVLKKYNVHATFYIIGRNVPGHASTLQRIHNEGHEIGNHSFTHSDLTRMPGAAIQQEIASTQAAIAQASGVTPTAFRPPYGAQNQTVRDIAASMGLSVNLWSVDPEDWSQPGTNTITQRVLSTDGPGSVVLLHILHQQTVDALPAIISGIRAQGYTLE